MFKWLPSPTDVQTGAEVAIALVPEDFGAGGSYKQMFRARAFPPAGDGGWYVQRGEALGSTGFPQLVGAKIPAFCSTQRGLCERR